MSKGLSEAQTRILIEARDKGDVLATRQRLRPCQMLVHAGLLAKVKGRAMIITPAGRAALSSRVKED